MIIDMIIKFFLLQAGVGERKAYLSHCLFHLQFKGLSLLTDFIRSIGVPRPLHQIALLFTQLIVLMSSTFLLSLTFCEYFLECFVLFVFVNLSLFLIFLFYLRDGLCLLFAKIWVRMQVQYYMSQQNSVNTFLNLLAFFPISHKTQQLL